MDTRTAVLLGLGGLMCGLCESASCGESTSPSTGGVLLETVFGKRRSPTQDVIHLRNGDVLHGHVVTDRITVTTPYGRVSLPLRRCAGIALAGKPPCPHTVVTVNCNRVSGTVGDRQFRFRIGSTTSEIAIPTEAIGFVALETTPDELGFVMTTADVDLFVMTNGDLLTGESADRTLTVRTDYAELPISFVEIRQIDRQPGETSQAVIKKKNGDVVRGALANTPTALDLEFGVRLQAVSLDHVAKVFVDSGHRQVVVELGLANGQAGEAGRAALGEPVAKDFVNSLGMKMVAIRPGRFWMGSPPGEAGRYPDEGPPHRVRISKGFYLGAHEVTQAQFEKLMVANPSASRRHPDCPVDSIPWEQAAEFCEKLSAKEGKTYRLPTEAEWEYACRAGSSQRYCFGNPESDLVHYAWFDRTYLVQTQPVGHKKPNAWGLYDMHGNVWEWCSDWNDVDYYLKSPEKDPLGPPGGSMRCLRGGCWLSPARRCRSACRHGGLPDSADTTIGFRVVCELFGGR